MPQDPGSIFGRLLTGCIRDEYVNLDKGALLEDVLFLILGAFSSVITTYALAMAGILL